MEILERGECLEGEKKNFCREKWKSETNIALKIYIEIAARWIDSCQALNLDRYESVKVLSRICQRQKFLDGSRFCQESINQTKSLSMDREAIETKSRKLDGSNMW